MVSSTSRVGTVIHVADFFDALKQIKRLEAEAQQPHGKGDPVITKRIQELKGYRDVFLKAEGPRRPRMTILERKADPAEPMSVEFAFSTGVQFYEGLSLSLQPGGLFVKTGELLPIDSLLDCTVRLEQEDIQFRISAKVIWINPRDSAGKPAGMGLKFPKIGPMQRQVLSDFLVGDLPAAALVNLSE